MAEEEKCFAKKAPVVPVPQEFIIYAEIGDIVRFTDTRGKKRNLTVVRKDERGVLLECHKTAYISTDTKLRLRRMESGEKIKFRVGKLPPIYEPIVLNIGDTLILHRDATPGEPAIVDADGVVTKPAHISCRQPEVFSFIQAGDPIHLNDGKIEGIVESVSDEELLVMITHARELGSRLRSDRGINFPKSDIQLRGLTDNDKTNLKFVVEHAGSSSRPALDRLPDLGHYLVCEIYAIEILGSERFPGKTASGIPWATSWGACSGASTAPSRRRSGLTGCRRCTPTS